MDPTPTAQGFRGGQIQKAFAFHVASLSVFKLELSAPKQSIGRFHGTVICQNDQRAQMNNTVFPTALYWTLERELLRASTLASRRRLSVLIA